MNPLVELNLALILFLPWYAILAVLFWLFPRQPRTFARKAFDSADPQYGHMWGQILATSLSYGVFLAAMAVAMLLRWRWLRGRAAVDFGSAPAATGGSVP